MKKLYNLFVFTAFAAAAACSNDGAEPEFAAPETAGNVQFALRAPQSARGPVYSADEFRILAFKNNGTDYVYVQDIQIGRAHV